MSGVIVVGENIIDGYFHCMVRYWGYIYIYIHTWTVLEPHNFRPLWIFGCGPKNHFWAKSDGFNDTVLVSKSWSFASFLRHFASYFWSFQMWLTEGKISNCPIFGRSLLFSPDQKTCSFWMSRYIIIIDKLGLLLGIFPLNALVDWI